MAAASNSFDLKKIIEEIVSFTKNRTENFGTVRQAKAPSAEQLATATLAALETGPKNAKQLSEAIAVASGGTMTPTSAQIRLTLEALIEQGFVLVSTKKDRKVYLLSEAGAQELSGAAARFAKTQKNTDETSGTGSSWLACDPKFLVAASKLGPVMLDLAQTGTREQQQQATELLDELRHELHRILAD
ncbi:MAG: hypothetical protein ACKORF_01055 [Micrococcales bacterium]